MTAPASYVVILPIIDLELAERCLETMAPEILSRTLVVDNTGRGRYLRSRWRGVLDWMTMSHNAGVATSWNYGLTAADHDGSDYLWILSQSIRFGHQRGVDFAEVLDEQRPPVAAHSQDGWKCLALARATWQRVGRFDPIFWPAYYEDTDYLWRMHLAGLPSPRANDGRLVQVNIDATSAGAGLMLQRKVVRLDYKAHAKLYADKWGGEGGFETLTHPYGDESLPWMHTGGPPRVRGRGGCTTCGGPR